MPNESESEKESNEKPDDDKSNNSKQASVLILTRLRALTRLSWELVK